MRGVSSYTFLVGLLLLLAQQQAAPRWGNKIIIITHVFARGQQHGGVSRPRPADTHLPHNGAAGETKFAREAISDPTRLWLLGRHAAPKCFGMIASSKRCVESVGA